MPDVFNELKPYTSTFVVNKVFASPDRYSHWEYRTRSTATTLINPSEELPMERGDLGGVHFTPKKTEAPPRKVEKIEERKHETAKFKIGGDHTEESKTDDHAAHAEKEPEHKAEEKEKETPVDVINAWIKANLQRTLVCLPVVYQQFPIPAFVHRIFLPTWTRTMTDCLRAPRLNEAC